MKIVRHGADLKAHIVNTTSQYNLPSNKVNLKNVGAREQVRKNFTEVSVQKNIDLDLDIFDCYAEQLSKVEWYIQTQTKQHNPVHLNLLKTIHGIGKILSLTILYEIGAVTRFETVQNFASYARLVKCKAGSTGKSYGTQGNKIGNAHLKWAFSETAIHYSKGNDKVKKYLIQLQKRKRMSKSYNWTIR